jgi:hypothetical protein
MYQQRIADAHGCDQLYRYLQAVAGGVFAEGVIAV